MRRQRATPGRQRGAVAVAAAIALVALLGFLAVVVDAGRLFVVKSELQNAADACALAAASYLDGTATGLEHAENAGMAVGNLNKANFQSELVAIAASDVKFAVSLSSAGGDNSNYLTRTGGAPLDSKYAMCTAQRAGVQMTLASLIGGTAKTVVASAVATVAPSQTSCAIPLGMCSQGPAPTYGFTSGQWYNGRFDAGGGLTGSFNWIDFTPPAGGQSELAALLTGTGTCNTGSGTPVGQAGVLGNAAARAWNSRFGLYQNGAGNPQASTAPPDYTGYTYTPASWPAQANSLADFLNTERAGYVPYQGNAATGLSISNAYNASSTQTHASGGNRRLVVAPIVDCAGWVSSQTVPIEAYACVLMLHPVGSPGDTVYMEYVGQANDPTSPCSTSGLAGGSIGPLVPVLVQ